MSQSRIASVLCALCLMASGASAQDDAKRQTLEEAINELMDVPATPAAFALDVSADQVARPGTLREAGAQLIGFVDSSGKFRPGAAVEIAPVELMDTPSKTVDDYARMGNARRLFQSLRVSLATSRATEDKADATPTLLSVGLRLGWDQRDYRYSIAVHEAIRATLEQVAPEHGGVCPEGADNCTTTTEPAQTVADTNAAIKRIYEALNEGFRVEFASATVLQAAGLYGNDGEAKHKRTRVWLAGDYASKALSFGLSLDYRVGDNPDTVQDNTVNAVRAGARFDIGGRTGSFGTQLAYTHESMGLASSRPGLIFGVSATVRVLSTFVVRAGVTGLYDEDRFAATFVLSTDWGKMPNLLAYSRQLAASS